MTTDFSPAVERGEGRQLSLYTNAALDELVEYYRRCGFVVRERRMEHGFDRVFMIKDVVSSANT